MSKILWICGCNSYCDTTMIKDHEKILNENKVTEILDYFHFHSVELKKEYYDKIIYDDSYSACSYSGERTIWYENFAKKYKNENIELFTERF
jgi:hypothetical protein